MPLALSLLTFVFLSTPQGRSARGGFHLSIAPIPQVMRINQPVKIRITNSGSQPDSAQLELEQFMTVEGGRPWWTSSDTEFYKTIDMLAVPPHTSVERVWYPGRRRQYKPVPGRRYRLVVLGEAALAGGGPVKYSNEFRFVRGRKHRPTGARRGKAIHR